MEISNLRGVRRRSKHLSIRKRIAGVSDRPRLCVRRTLKHIIAQVVDDKNGKSILQIHSKSLKLSEKKIEVAKAMGKTIAEKLMALGFEKVVFDRGGYLYHGRIRAVAEGARENGLKF